MGVYRRAEELAAAGETVALVTVTAVSGSAPRDPGATMLVRGDGSTAGTIGGGNVENLSREAAVEAIEAGESSTAEWELRPEGNTGMVCDGHMEVFINVLAGRRTLLIAGGGHIAVPLTELAAAAGYDPVVIEDRAEYADPERFHPDTTVHHTTPEEGFAAATVTENTAVVVATRSSALDRRAAACGLRSDAFYVGAVASERKAAHIREGLREEDGVPAETVADLHAPVGLDLGGDAPRSITVSVLAEVELEYNDATGDRLSTGA